ncbi:MAG TPA: magnesium transporter [Candidatus Limnocylindria bacterium]|nr:magnesium transporter [Candidatus Limnocylindria bacterium]
MRFRKTKLPTLSSVPPALTNLAAMPITVLNPKVLTDILFKKDKRTELFLELSPQKRLLLLRSLTPSVRRDILVHVPDKDLLDLLHMVDPDEATDLLQLLTPHRREKILQQVSAELKHSLSTLLEFDAETAAGLMTLDYVQVEEGDTIAEVARKFKTHEKSTGRPPVIVVMKEDGKLAGFLPGHELGFGRASELIGKYVKRLPSISYAATHDEVIHMFHAHPHAKVAVKNDAGDVIGIIYSDDILNLMQEKEASSLYDFAGIRQEESIADSTHRKVKNRYQWLIINLGTAFLAAFTIGQFEEILNQFVLLAVYMPIVAGMGGNAATQTLAVLVRGISLGQIDLKTAGRTLRNELGAGFINGMINAVLVALVVIVVNHDFKIAIVLAMAMIINLVVAAFFGTLVPLIMTRLGKDPAASATIFITTATDVLGFLAFLGLATLILA